MRRGALVALVLLWTGVAAAPASAADVTFFQGQELKITGAPGESSRLSVRFFPDREASVHDDAGTLRPGLGCLGTFYDVSCPQLLPLQQCHPCSVSIDLGDGNDTLTLAGQYQKSPFAVSAGAGDDDVHILADTLAVVDGGPGRDRLRADTYSELDGGEGADVIEGNGTASYAKRSGGVTVTLDGAANDGAPGENDNVTAPHVIGGAGADSLTGDDRVNELNGGGGDDVLGGGGGADLLRGVGGTNRLDGGDGNDTVDGSPGDAVKCGRGADVALGLQVPGTYGDCEAVFSSTGESPYLTVSNISLSRRRPQVTLGWHHYPPAYPGAVEFPEPASGIVELRYRGKVIGRGTFADASRPAPRSVALRLNARGKALACRSARNVRLLVVATSAQTFSVGHSAIRRDARLPRVGTCAKKKPSKR